MNKEVKIEKLDYYGNGIAYINKKITFIPNTLPNEEVLVEITKAKKKYNEAKVLEYKKNSTKRISNPCEFVNCGGCDLLHICYKEELLYKQNKVLELFNEYKVNSILSSNNEFNYRNKITLKVINGVLGLYEKNSHKLVKINKCLLVNPKINDIINELNNYDLTNVEEIIIKAYHDSMIILKTSRNYKIFKDLNVDNIIIVNNNKEIILKGNNYIIENIGDINYYISLNSFFQINPYSVKILYDEIIKLGEFSKKDIVLDLYSGVGSISLYISSYVKKVIGIEINKIANKDANRNKIFNNIENAEFYCLNANEIDINIKPNIVIIDPPRNGLDNKTINILKTINSNKIIYVSCNPITLKRDIELLKDLYKVKCISPIDMFPKTYHVECICLLYKN